MPQSAWNLYFRYNTNAACHPHLHMDPNELSVVDKERYKSYVVAILITDPVRMDDACDRKYGGCDSFGGMSKDIGRQWKQADALTKAVFKELASEDAKRHKKDVFESYKAFTKKLPDPTLQWKKIPAEQITFPCSDKAEVMAVKNETVETIAHSNEPCVHPIGEVNMTDQKMEAVIHKVWGLDNVQAAQEELAHFLSGIEWD